MLGSLVFMHGFLCCEGHKAYSIVQEKRKGETEHIQNVAFTVFFFTFFDFIDFFFAFSLAFSFLQRVCDAIFHRAVLHMLMLTFEISVTKIQLTYMYKC